MIKNDDHKEKSPEQLQLEGKIQKNQRITKIALVIALILGMIGLMFFFHAFLHSNKSKPNEIGDYIGGTAGSLWTLAGLVIIYMAFISQQTEILLQRAELRETRDIFEKQYSVMLTQQRENTFFGLIDNYRKWVESLSRTEMKLGGGTTMSDKLQNLSTKEISGYEIVRTISDEWVHIFNEWKNYLRNGSGFNYKFLKDDVPSIIMDTPYVDEISEKINHLVQYVCNTFDELSKEFYLATINNSLSSDEKFLLSVYNSNGYGDIFLDLLGLRNDNLDFRDIDFYPIINDLHIEAFNGIESYIYFKSFLKPKVVLQVVFEDEIFEYPVKLIGEENYTIEFHNVLLGKEYSVGSKKVKRILQPDVRILLKISVLFRKKLISLFTEIYVKEITLNNENNNGHFVRITKLVPLDKKWLKENVDRIVY